MERLHWGAIWHIILASRGKSRTRQNGFFKMALVTKCKRDLLTQKERRHAAFAVEKEDIVDLVSKAWDESFAHIATNQKAVAEQGYGPSNYNLLLHPEIQLTSTSNLQTEANNNQPVSSIPPSGLNLSQGITGTLVDQVSTVSQS